MKKTTHKIFVIIPVYNEEKNIVRCVKNVLKYWKHVIVVNDGSTDNTKKMLDLFASKIQVLHLPNNQGKGFAMLCGAKHAFKQKANGIIFMDGDNQHNPKHISSFVDALKSGSHILIGVRLLKTNIPFHRKIGNRLMAFIMKYLFTLSIPDMMCGFRAFSKKGFKQVRWNAKRYGVETEMLTIIGRKKIPYSQIIVDTIYHDKYKGFSLRDGLSILCQLPLWKMKRI